MMPDLPQLGGDPGHRVGDTALVFRSVSRYPGKRGSGDHDACIAAPPAALSAPGPSGAAGPWRAPGRLRPRSAPERTHLALALRQPPVPVASRLPSCASSYSTHWLTTPPPVAGSAARPPQAGTPHRRPRAHVRPAPRDQVIPSLSLCGPVRPRPPLTRTWQARRQRGRSRNSPREIPMPESKSVRGHSRGCGTGAATTRMDDDNERRNAGNGEHEDAQALADPGDGRHRPAHDRPRPDDRERRAAVRATVAALRHRGPAVGW